MQLRNTLPTAVLGLALLACLTAPAQAGETGLDGLPHWTVVAPGADFYQVSTTTRSSFIPNPQTDPFTATMPAPPLGTQIVEVFALWNYHLDGLAPISDTVGINGVAVAGTRIGQGDPAIFPLKDRTAAYIAQGIAPLLNFGGANTISAACDKALGSDPNALGAGMSIVVVYKAAHGPERRVSVYAGFASIASSPSLSASARLALPTNYLGGSAHLFMNALDGQSLFSDTFAINGITAGGVLAGTVAANNAWQGLKGPGQMFTLYDCVDDEVQAFMTVGDSELRARTEWTGPGVSIDLVGHSFAALSTVESCGAWITYCTAKLNSLGCTPIISAVGTPSAGALGSPFSIRLSNTMNNMNGLLFYGYGQQALPFQGGTLCVAPPITRLGAQNSGGTPAGQDCSGKMEFNFNAHIAGGSDPLLVVGQTVFAQYWTRDIGDPFGSGLSAGICFDLCQ